MVRHIGRHFVAKILPLAVIIVATGCQAAQTSTERARIVAVAKSYVVQRMNGYDTDRTRVNVVDDGSNWVVEFYPVIPEDETADVVAVVSPSVLIRKSDLEVIDFKIDQ